MITVFLLMIVCGAILLAISIQRPLSLREQSDREFDALLARERTKNPWPNPPAFGWPRMFFLTDNERAFLQRDEPWLLFAVLFVLLIVVTVGGGYLRVHGLI